MRTFLAKEIHYVRFSAVARNHRDQRIRGCGHPARLPHVLELAWDFKAFSALLAPLDDKRIDALVIGHYWDNGFAIAYSIALCSFLQLLAGYLPHQVGAGLSAISWYALAAGGLDLVENQCLLRRFATIKRERGNDPMDRPVDGLLRLAAVAAALKFALLGLCLTALVWGFLQGIALCLTKG